VYVIRDINPLTVINVLRVIIAIPHAYFVTPLPAVILVRVLVLALVIVIPGIPVQIVKYVHKIIIIIRLARFVKLALHVMVSAHVMLPVNVSVLLVIVVVLFVKIAYLDMVGLPAHPVLAI